MRDTAAQHILNAAKCYKRIAQRSRDEQGGKQLGWRDAGRCLPGNAERSSRPHCSSHKLGISLHREYMTFIMMKNGTNVKHIQKQGHPRELDQV